MTRLRSLGVAPEFALYLLPNGVAVRFTESADLLGLRHKLAMRLCYNAQEEIWRVALDEARQIREVNPVIGSYLFPPCRLREMAGITPPARRKALLRRARVEARPGRVSARHLREAGRSAPARRWGANVESRQRGMQ